MIITIEFIVIVGIVIVLVGWVIWKRTTDWFILKSYNPHNDKSRNGEEIRRKDFGRREPISEGTVDSIPRPSESKRQDLLQATTFDDLIKSERINGEEQSTSGETSNSIGKPKSIFRNPFRRKK